MHQLHSNKEVINQYLRGIGYFEEGETLQFIEKPGQGNMNFTLRVATNQRTFILKQSRPYVEKYPQVAAPVQRIHREAAFYALIEEQKELSAWTPDVLHLDQTNNVLLLEDLGVGTDYTSIYQVGKNMSEKDLIAIIDFAAKLHQSYSAKTASQVIVNREMRALNHEHIFHYPYLDDNGLNLDDILPGLAAIAHPFKVDAALKAVVQKLGEKYLADGDTLLHGDYFPGSWLKTEKGIRIIDPEFCFFGFPEFEIGVCLAHLKMADQSEALIEKAWQHYRLQTPLDQSLCQQFMAIEILRRILGLAQLPLSIDVQQRGLLLQEARATLLD